MKKKQLVASLAATGIMMSSIAGNVFADSSVETNLTHTPVIVDSDKINKTKDIIVITPDGFEDKFIVKLNKVGNKDATKYSGYKITPEVTDTGVEFTLVAQPGTTLGELSNSQNIIDSKETLPGGNVVYKFHYTFFNGGTRTININVTDINSISKPEENVTQPQQNISPTTEENIDSVVVE